MKCKNKEVIVNGVVYDDRDSQLYSEKLRVIITNDERGKTVSIDNGVIQFTVPFDNLVKFLL